MVVLVVVVMLRLLVFVVVNIVMWVVVLVLTRLKLISSLGLGGWVEHVTTVSNSNASCFRVALS